ncbi:MAG: DUF6713 family protein [Cyanobacteria bacterium J06621_11]
MIIVLFYLGFASLITHEMDAITHAEWRLLYVFRKLPENVASTLFVAVHVPLFALLMWLTHHESSLLQQSAQNAIMLFLIIHSFLHKRLEHHEQYTFHTLLSKSLIYGSGLLGLLYYLAISRRYIMS